MIFVGNDWAEDHHDVYLMDEAGGRLDRGGYPRGGPVSGGFHELVASHAQEPDRR